MIRIIFAITLSILIFAGCGRMGKEERNAMNKEISEKIAQQNAAVETPQEPVKEPETNAETKPEAQPETQNGGQPEIKTEAPTDSAPKLVPEENVKKMIFALLEGATDKDIRKMEKDLDDGKWKYEIEVIYKGLEYDFEIDAETGQILSWESESIYD